VTVGCGGGGTGCGVGGRGGGAADRRDAVLEDEGPGWVQPDTNTATRC